jgi:hypothetical protein
MRFLSFIAAAIVLTLPIGTLSTPSVRGDLNASVVLEFVQSALSGSNITPQFPSRKRASSSTINAQLELLDGVYIPISLNCSVLKSMIGSSYYRGNESFRGQRPLHENQRSCNFHQQYSGCCPYRFMHLFNGYRECCLQQPLELSHSRANRGRH